MMAHLDHWGIQDLLYAPIDEHVIVQLTSLISLQGPSGLSGGRGPPGEVGARVRRPACLLRSSSMSPHSCREQKDQWDRWGHGGPLGSRWVAQVTPATACTCYLLLMSCAQGTSGPPGANGDTGREGVKGFRGRAGKPGSNGELGQPVATQLQQSVRVATDHESSISGFTGSSRPEGHQRTTRRRSTAPASNQLLCHTMFSPVGIQGPTR